MFCVHHHIRYNVWCRVSLQKLLQHFNVWFDLKCLLHNEGYWKNHIIFKEANRSAFQVRHYAVYYKIHSAPKMKIRLLVFNVDLVQVVFIMSQFLNWFRSKNKKISTWYLMCFCYLYQRNKSLKWPYNYQNRRGESEFYKLWLI